MENLKFNSWLDSVKSQLLLGKKSDGYTAQVLYIPPMKSLSLDLEKMLDSIDVKYVFQFGNREFNYFCYWSKI